MTPRWAKITQLVESRPDLFDIVEVGNGFREVRRKVSDKLTAEVNAMLVAMSVQPTGVQEILEIDPIQTVPPILRSLWAGRGFKVADTGVITLLFHGSKKIYQYPFIDPSPEHPLQKASGPDGYGDDPMEVW
jgi:hypothetical protein